MNIPTLTVPDFSELKDIVYSLWERVKAEMLIDLQVEEKDGKELVTRIDRLIELEARKLIKQEFWNVNFLWEEFPDEDNGSDIIFIIDPLDGTESFINREFNTTISIWIQQDWKLVHGVVYDFMKDILYEGAETSTSYMQKNKIPLLRQNYSDQTRVLVSGRWEDVEEIQEKLKVYPHIRVTRSYGSIALQTVQTWTWNYEWYIRAGKMKQWDIAGAAPFIQSLDDTSILSRTWEEFNYHSCKDGLIVVRNSFKDEFLEILDV